MQPLRSISKFLFDEKAVEAIFCDKTDYVLEQAVKELEAQNE